MGPLSSFSIFTWPCCCSSSLTCKTSCFTNFKNAVLGEFESMTNQGIWHEESMCCKYKLFCCQRLCLFMTQLCVPVTHIINSVEVISHCCSLFPSLSELSCCSFFPELGSNPLKSAGIDDGAFVDLKRVSYIRIADTNITQIPKGENALISLSTNYSFMREFGFIWLLSSNTQPNTTLKRMHAWIEFYSKTLGPVWKRSCMVIKI